MKLRFPVIGAASLVASAVIASAAPEGTAVPADAAAQTAAKLEAYTETIPDTQVAFDMVPIAGGTFTMGSPANEPGRQPDEGPQVQVKVEPFWMGKLEVTWSEYDLFAFAKRVRRKPGETPTGADAVAKPTPPYADESWGFGKETQPAIGMMWHAAAEYCRWLSAKTGKTYRLPTEAEWEYAARAGTTTAWSSGPSPDGLKDVAWYAANSEAKPHVGAQKKPNAWGLYDMHGNVAEWAIDQYEAKRYAALAGGPKPVLAPVLVRGGGFEDEPAMLRSAARRSSNHEWSRRDPQLPQSIWWHTDAIYVGFRLVRPAEETASLKGFASKITRESADYPK
jgi:formylglycine-generating enzyme required for sulfatase activity